MNCTICWLSWTNLVPDVECLTFTFEIGLLDWKWCWHIWESKQLWESKSFRLQEAHFLQLSFNITNCIMLRLSLVSFPFFCRNSLWSSFLGFIPSGHPLKVEKLYAVTLEQTGVLFLLSEHYRNSSRLFYKNGDFYNWK